MNKKERNQINKQMLKKTSRFCKKQLNDTHVEYICTKNTSRLNCIDLQSNLITHIGMVHISCASWLNLYGLNLRSNRIGSLGCKYLSKAHMQMINNAFLMDNQIDSFGVWHLAKRSWKKLEILDLKNNKIGVDGVHWILKQNWKSICQIDMSQNQISIQQILKFALFQSKGLQFLYLSNNLTMKYEFVRFQNILQSKFGYIQLQIPNFSPSIISGDQDNNSQNEDEDDSSSQSQS